MHRAANNLAIFGEYGLHVSLRDQQGVEVANEDSGVEGAGVGLIGHVAAGHQAGGGGGPTRTRKRSTWSREAKTEINLAMMNKKEANIS